jgi:hypothetical protein
MKIAYVALGSVAAVLFMAGWAPPAAQQRVIGRGGTQFNFELLRPSGGPVVPIFEGWYENDNGTHELSFGYFNVNTEEVIEVPLGPDNFIEPAEFDGSQPTHFLPVPSRDRRHYGVFTVTIPADFGDRDVVWTLRVRGQTLSVPGHTTSINYRLNSWIFPERRSTAPLLKLTSAGPEGRGPAGVRSGPVEATVGRPLPLRIWTTRSDLFPDETTPISVNWIKHQGPGDVVFEPQRLRLATEVWREAAAGSPTETTATFSEPGAYVLRVRADNGGGFESHCCWTNGYVEVTVR